MKDNKKNINFLKQIKNYFLIKEIKKGTTGTVYKALDDKTKEIVAIKAISAKKLRDKKALINLRKEITLLHKLSGNPHIISLLGFEQTSNNIYVVLEHCNGGSLFDYKNYYEKKTRLKLNELFIQKIVRQVVDGLEYMHKNNMVHRDIKIDNILINFNSYTNKVFMDKIPDDVNLDKVSLNDPFTIKISDLGYARELNQNEAASTICGTPAIMSPEIALGAKGGKTYNSKVDLWSLGALTYELLVGYPPFNCSTNAQYFDLLKKGLYKLPKTMKVSVEIISFINGLLQFNPEKRMDWAKIKAHPFITKEAVEFTFIDLQSVEGSKGKNVEVSTKEPNNFLWLLYKNNNLNIDIDEISQEAIAKKEVKEQITKSKIINEEVVKAVEEEKRKILVEKERLNKEKIEMENQRKMNEEMKKNYELLQKKNEEEQENLKKKNEELIRKNDEDNKKFNDLKEKEKENKDEIEKLKVINKKTNEDFQKQLEELKRQNEELLKKNKEVELKIKEAKVQIENANKIKDENDKQNKELKEKIAKDNDLKKKYMEEQKRKEKELQEEVEKLNGELKKLKIDKDALKSTVKHKLNAENELKIKQKEIEGLESQIKRIRKEKEDKDRLLLQMQDEMKEEAKKIKEENEGKIKQLKEQIEQDQEKKRQFDEEKKTKENELNGEIEKLKKQLKQLESDKNEMKSTIRHKENAENELKNKQKEIEKLEQKMREMNDEKDRRILEMEKEIIKKKEQLKEVEELKQNLNGKSKEGDADNEEKDDEIKGETEDLNELDKLRKKLEEDGWEDVEFVDDETKSVNLDYDVEQGDIFDTYEIIENYIDDDEKKGEKEKNTENKEEEG